MSFNKTSSVSPNKRNLKRMNRLHDNGKFSTFDNAGFENDIKDADGGDDTLFHHEQSLTHRDSQSNPRRHLPNRPASLDTGSNVNKTRAGSNQNLPEIENVELKVKNDNSNQQDQRKVLGSINSDVTSNNRLPDSKELDPTSGVKTPGLKGDKASKLTFNVNLKRFELTANNNTSNDNDTQIKDRLKMSRPSLTYDASTDRRGSEELDTVDSATFTRSASMRVCKPRRRAPRLLRDISFSDADDSATKDYGSLKTLNLPRRQGKEPIGVDTVGIIESLMHDLIKRGKIYQVALLDLDESEVIASVPSGILTKADALGMTKSIICQPSLFKLHIGKVDYSCFKHRQHAVQGRATDLVMVMQMTETCVVAGFSRDDAPGSCNSEVNEFTKVLEEAGW